MAKKKKSCKIIKRKKGRENGKVIKIDTILWMDEPQIALGAKFR